MASTHVFPGGVVEEVDGSFPPTLCAQEELAWRLDEEDRKHRVAALRETFEETGLLLAAGLASPLIPARTWRERVSKTPGDLGTLCRECAARLRVSELRPFAHWVTPPQEKWRYDTRFYLAVLPLSEARAADAVCADDSEVRAATWTTPSAALAAFAEARWSLPPPTWHTLRALSAARSWRTLERMYPRVPVEDPPRWMPSLVTVDNAICVILPGDALHEDSADGDPARRHRIVMKGAYDYELQHTL